MESRTTGNILMGSRPHRCRHCEAIEIAVSAEVRSHYSPTQRQWRYRLNQSVADASSAASAGCHFFSRVCSEISRSDTPAEQLLRTQIELELGAGETTGHYVAENSHSLVVIISTAHYSWPAARFTLVSSFNDASAHHAIARCIVGDVSATCSIDQIRKRLDHCRAYHALCRSADHSEDTHKLRPRRFLNVKPVGSGTRVTLVRADPARVEPYITLSYVWGQDQTVKTTLEALARHSTSGIEISTLPKTIRDAIQVTRHLQVNLLWVDSLCIVQDDADELAREIANMSSYYGNSLLTISASAAKSAAEGFLHPNSHTADDRDQRTYELPFRFNDSTKGYVRLLPPRDPCSEAIDTRAWTLQEGLTSSRLVSFGRDTISWSCLSDNHGEVRLGSLRQRFRECGAQMEGRLMVPTFQAGRSSREFWVHVWNDIVYDYCDRQLSDPADGLAAISGIANELSAAVQRGNVRPIDPSVPMYLAGLWNSDHLPLQLLWQPREPRQYPPRDVYVAPSWSWAAVRAPLRRYDEEAYLRWLQRWWNYYRAQLKVPFKFDSCNLKLSNNTAPYGALKSGSLMVYGRTCTTDASSLHAGKLGGMTISLDVGGHSSHPDFLSQFSQKVGDVPLTLLEVCPGSFEDKTGEKFPAGLALTKDNDGNYRRVGLLFYAESTVISWETATLKLV